MFKDVPMKIVLPIIIITWVLSLISSLAIVSVAPSLLGIKAGIDEGAVTSDKIATGAVITLKMADGNVTSAKILDGTITTADLATGAISNVNIVNGAVTAEKIADGSVTSGKIADNAIVTIKLADSQVTSAKILNGTITAADLDSGLITEMQIANGEVTTSKIADQAVTDKKLAPKAIAYAQTYGYAYGAAYTTTYTDIPDMSVNIILNRNSSLIILFSAEANLTVPTGTNKLRVHAEASPTGYFSPYEYYLLTTPGPRATYSCIFYSAVTVSTTTTYTVKMRYALYTTPTSGTFGAVWYRTMIVIALPA